MESCTLSSYLVMIQMEMVGFGIPFGRTMKPEVYRL